MPCLSISGVEPMSCPHMPCAAYCSIADQGLKGYPSHTFAGKSIELGKDKNQTERMLRRLKTLSLLKLLKLSSS